jgi:hypothetical protein
MGSILGILLWFSILTIAWPLPTRADEYCSPIRLDQDKGSMSQVPVLDQGQFNDCGAVTGAQMIDAYRFSH